jgi:hypothetical protein
MRITNFLFAVVALLLVASCAKPTAESETKAWESSKQTLETLGAKYPGFKPALEEVKNEASKQWDAALEVSDDEKKVEAMRAANTAAKPSFVGQLDGMSDAIESLKDLSTEATQAGSVDDGDREALRIAQNEANITLNSVEGMLKSRQIATATEARAVVEEAAKQVENAKNRIQKVMDTVLGKKNAAKAAADTASANDAAKETAKEEAKNPIKCGFCGTMNKHDALKCSSCGAPVEK